MKTLTAALWISCVAAGCSRTAGSDKPAGLPPSATPSTGPVAAAAPSAPAPFAAPPSAPPIPAETGGEAEMVPSAPDPKQTISGTLVLPAARKNDVSKGDTLFLIARRAGGAPGFGSMLAVQRLTAGDFPMPFSLSGRDAMVPGTPFEGSISITVRVDKDGDPLTRRKGDLLGQANDIKVGTQTVTISLDTLQKEDVTLAGGMAGNKPPGHP